MSGPRASPLKLQFTGKTSSPPIHISRVYLLIEIAHSNDHTEIPNTRTKDASTLLYWPTMRPTFKKEKKQKTIKHHQRDCIKLVQVLGALSPSIRRRSVDSREQDVWICACSMRVLYSSWPHSMRHLHTLFTLSSRWARCIAWVQRRTGINTTGCVNASIAAYQTGSLGYLWLVQTLLLHRKDSSKISLVWPVDRAPSCSLLKYCS